MNKRVVVGLAILVGFAIVVLAVPRDSEETQVRVEQDTKRAEQVTVVSEQVARREAIAEAVARFPERKARISELIAQLQEAVLAGGVAVAVRDELRAILEPVFESEIATRPDVVKLRDEYEFWSKRSEVALIRSRGHVS